MFFMIALILYFIVQIHHYEYKYGFAYDMVKREEIKSEFFFVKYVSYLLYGSKISKNTLMIIFLTLASMFLSNVPVFYVLAY